MAFCRDWKSTLWRASYKGVPFFVEKDNEAGGRRIAIHQFPHRDDPFLEDMGEDTRNFDVTAYLASDAADAQAAAVIAAGASKGEGILVLPAHGPIKVRCLSFSRDRTKDRAGYIGFSGKFIRAGQASSLVTVASLGNAISTAVDGLMSAAGGALSTAASILGVADYVASSLSGALLQGIGSFEAIRTSSSVEVTASAEVRDELASAVALMPTWVSRTDGISADLVPAIFDAARDLGAGMPPAAVMRDFPAAALSFASPAPSANLGPNDALVAANEAEGYRITRLALLGAYAEAIVNAPLASRQEGISARADVAEIFEAEMEDASALPTGAALVAAIQTVRDATTEYLTRRIVDLAPVANVSANLSMPSLFWAWRLYNDPLRADELVARNRVQHPSFMGTSFEALVR